VALAGMWILNFKIRKYMSADFKYRGKCFYTLYQKNIGLIVGCTIGMMQVISRRVGIMSMNFSKIRIKVIFGWF
jgi:hypothetical protein